MKFLVISVFTLLIAACNQSEKFDKSAWREKGDLNIYQHRDKMLNDLMNHHRLKGLTYKQLIDLLGEPEKYSDEAANTATYNILTDYGKDIDPVYIKNLEVKFSSDSIVTDGNINETSIKRRPATANIALAIWRGDEYILSFLFANQLWFRRRIAPSNRINNELLYL